MLARGEQMVVAREMTDSEKRPSIRNSFEHTPCTASFTVWPGTGGISVSALGAHLVSVKIFGKHSIYVSGNVQNHVFTTSGRAIQVNPPPLQAFSMTPLVIHHLCQQRRRERPENDIPESPCENPTLSRRMWFSMSG